MQKTILVQRIGIAIVGIRPWYLLQRDDTASSICWIAAAPRRFAAVPIYQACGVGTVLCTVVPDGQLRLYRLKLVNHVVELSFFELY